MSIELFDPESCGRFQVSDRKIAIAQIQEESAPLAHPATEELELAAVLRALAEPIRLEIVAKIARDPSGERQCGSFQTDLDCSKQNLSHHLRVLREAGVTRVREDGRSRFISLRRDDLEHRFPGLLDSILRGAATGG